MRRHRRCASWWRGRMRTRPSAARCATARNARGRSRSLLRLGRRVRGFLVLLGLRRDRYPVLLRAGPGMALDPDPARVSTLPHACGDTTTGLIRQSKHRCDARAENDDCWQNPPKMQIEAVKAAYRRYARVYDMVFGAVLQPGRRAVIEALRLKPGDRVLEVGVGTGISLPLYPRDVRLTGVDVSSEMLERARARVARAKLANVEALLEMDAEQMSFPDASFDKVVAMYVISVVPRPAKVLEELHRVCRPDGEIFLVNHFQSDNPILGGFERAIGAFSSQIGFDPQVNLRSLVPSSANGDVSRVNLLWKMVRLRNGVSHKL